MKRFCFLAVGASLLTLTAADADAAWRHRLQRRTYCCPPVHQYHAPVTRAPVHSVQPPGAPIQGESSQAQSVEPQAPPAAPAQGRTIRRYSVEPAAPVYQQPAPSTSSQGPPRNPVERRLRPGSGFRR